MTTNEAIRHTLALTEQEKDALNDKHNWLVGERIARCHSVVFTSENRYKSGLQYRGDVFMIIEAERWINKCHERSVNDYYEFYRGLTQIVEGEEL